jgi:hypothetical protein
MALKLQWMGRRPVCGDIQTRPVFVILAITNPACLQPPCRC